MSKHACTANDNMLVRSLGQAQAHTPFPRKEVSEGVWEAWGPILPFTRPFIYTSYGDEYV